MGCKGVRITPDAMLSLFNYELVLRRGYSLMDRNDFEGDPEALRSLVEHHLKTTAPGVRVGFWDHYSEMRTEAPDPRSYCLLIEDGTSPRSTAMH